MADSQFSLSVIFRAVDMITAPARKISSTVGGINRPIAKVKAAANNLGRVTGIKQLNKQLAENRARWKASAGSAKSASEKMARSIKAAAASVVLGTMLNQRAAVDDALGGLASLGVKDLKVVEAAAENFSENWSRFSQSQILEAAYRVKSGIGDLTDAGLAEFSKMAALTATATRGEVDAVSMAFGQGFNVFRKQFKTDEAFANAFSAAMSKTVKDFQTDGGELSAAMKNLGASATNMKVPLAQQMVVLGNLQNVMGSGAAAGTAYKSMMNQLIPAGKKLNTTFTDTNGAAMSIDQIVAKIEVAQKKAQEAGKGAEFQDSLRQAFGDEAFAALSNLIGKSDQLKKQIISTTEATKEGAAYTEKMAKLADQGLGSTLRKATSLVGNLAGAIGGALAPVINVVVWVVTGFVNIVRFAIATVPGLGFVLKTIVGIAAALALAIGIASAANWAWNTSMMMSAKTITRWLIPSLLKAVVGTWSFTAALLANPITWVVVGIMALVTALVLLWRYWDDVVDFLEGCWEGAKAAWNVFVGWIDTGVKAIGKAFKWLFQPVTALVDLMGGIWKVITGEWNPDMLWDAGAAMITGLWDGLKAIWARLTGWLSDSISAVTDIVGGIADFFGFGDDDEGKAKKPLAGYKNALKAQPSGAPVGAAQAFGDKARSQAAAQKASGATVDGVVRVQFENAPKGTRLREVSQKGSQGINVAAGLSTAMVPG